MSNKNLDIFHDFFRSNQHLLKKGDNNWPTDKILFQLAYEHAEDSPITKQAEKFLAQQRVEGSWFSLLNKIKHASKNPNYLTFDLHTNGVQGVHLMEDNRALSWSGLRGVFGRDKTLRLWNLQDGSSKVFEGHNDLVQGVHLMEDNRALSWSNDGTICLWDLTNGMLAKYYFEGISKVFLTQLSNRILCFSSNRHRILELSD